MFFLLLRLEINGNLKSARPTINLLIVLLWPECILIVIKNLLYWHVMYFNEQYNIVF